MERIVSCRYSEQIEAAFRLIPEAIAGRLRATHFFTGTDPIFAGLGDWETTGDGRSYRETMCCAYPSTLLALPKALRQTTVIMPNLQMDYPAALRPVMVVHELGHVMDEQMGFRYEAQPVTTYARTNRAEAFAEAFTLWCFPQYAEHYPLVGHLNCEEWEYAITQAANR